MVGFIFIIAYCRRNNKVCTDIYLGWTFFSRNFRKKTHTHTKHCAHAGRKLLRKCSGLAQFPFYASKLKITANRKLRGMKNLNMITFVFHLI